MSKAQIEFENETNKKQLEELKEDLGQKNTRIYNLTKENHISKEINQTLVKLLKLKNVQIQSIKLLNSEKDLQRKEELQVHIDKFQSEEKKLLKL